jgi:protein O-GlcNAc transferase
MTRSMLKSLFSRRPALDIHQAMQQAWTFRRQGNLDDAEQLCHAVLRDRPGDFDAKHLLGVIRLQQTRYDEAERLLTEALNINPNSVDALAGRGSALLGLGRPSDALASFESALAINSELPEVHVDRGAALQFLGRPADALASYDRALKIRPDFLPALTDRANVLQVLHRHDDAIADLTQALAVAPDDFASLSGLGHALDAQDRREEALAAYERALAVRPGDVALLNARASALYRLGRHAEAMIEWDRALASDSRLVPALVGRGNVLHVLGRSEEALADFDKAIEASPDYAVAPYNRGIVLNELGRYDEAIAAYQWAIAIKPDFVQALFNCGALLSERNRHEEAIASFERVLAADPEYPLALGNLAYVEAQCCSWQGRDQVVQRVEEGVRRGKPVNVPLAFLALSPDAEAQRICAASLVANKHPSSPHPLWTGEVYGHDRIRVAYVSADFHEHALAILIAGLFEQHDHDRFETTGIVFGPDKQSPLRSRIETTFDQVVDIRRKSDAEAAQLVRELEIDIAVDLMGFTNGSRTGIFAHRPAPVQVNYLGYPGTMGAEYMDYILADRYLIPDTLRRHYAENVVYLPDTFQVNDAKRRVSDVTPSRSDVGLPLEGFVFCAFNNSFKITPDVFAVWMRLLDRVPGSVLWLIANNSLVEANLRREAQDRGVAPNRLVFAPRLPYPEHLARYRLADLFLDTLPFNAGTTASDALWAGLPVLTCSGEAFAARMAGSLLHAVGLPELITHSLADYEALAFQLATDAPRLFSIRQELARNRDTYPLFDTDRFRRNLEAAFRTMWEKTQRGETPASFAVEG